MKFFYLHFLIGALIVFPVFCIAQPLFSLNNASNSLDHLYGKKNNSDYLYTTAGDKLYAIGDQAGNFPSVGFHVPGEMGGIWQQPIKLLDGFRLKVVNNKTQIVSSLNKCDSFITYPFTSTFKYTLAEQNLSVTRTQFVPDGKPVLVVEYDFTNSGNEAKDIQIELSADINLMPVWLGERSGMIDGTDEIIINESGNTTLLAKDKNNSWYVGISCGKQPAEFIGMEKTSYKDNGLTANIITSLHIEKGKSTIVHFYFSGSIKDGNEVKKNIASVENSLPILFNLKKERYEKLDRNAAIEIPDKSIMEAYKWGKYSTDWLVRDVPGLGRALSAGLPDYPWFFSSDQATTFNALVGTIQPNIFFSSWEMLKGLSNKANNDTGRIIHEASTNGVVYDKGRMEESQLHIITAWNIFRWTGGLTFLKENYEYGKKVWAWLKQHDTTNNGYIEGYGGVEIEGLNEEMLDVQVQTQIFLRVMSQMSLVLDDTNASLSYNRAAKKLKRKINKDWWVAEDNRYADFISSKKKAIEIIDSALVQRVHPNRNEWAQKKLTELKYLIQNGKYKHTGYVVYYNASGILPVAEGIADTAKAKEVLKHIYWFTNKFGLYITGIERPDNISLDDGDFKHSVDFNYNRAVMPVATSDVIISACRYGYIDTALKYMHVLLESFNYATPGTTYEVSPNYGMFVQAWNITGFNVPLIQYFFGIDPIAYRRQITLRPDFPSKWKSAQIKNVIIGDNLLSLHYSKEVGVLTYEVKMSKPNWLIKLKVPTYKTIKVNGEKVKAQDGFIFLTHNVNKVQLSN
ncbi:MAG: hypothetical protein ABI168_11850 [Ginsengibacter sp.]